MKPLPWRVRAELFLQLARLEAAGLPWDQGLASVGLPAPGAKRLKVMQHLSARGVDPAKAGEQSGLFTKLEARLVRAALASGSPATVYAKLAQRATQHAMMWTAIRARLMLPAFVLVIALWVQPLPALISRAISPAGYAWQVLWPLLAIIVLAAMGRWLLAVFPRVPLHGPIFVRTNLRDFFESLGMMLEAGIPVLEALPAAVDTVTDAALRRDLLRIRRSVDGGATFAASLEGVRDLRGSPVLALAHTGEASGTLPGVLLRWSGMESEAIAQSYKQLATWLPRIVYILVSLKIVAGIAALGGNGPRVPADL